MVEQEFRRPGLIAFCTGWLQRHQFSRFLIVGAVNTIVTYLIYVTLVLFCAYPVAYTVTWALGIFISYFLNARLVFRIKLRLVSALQYPVVYLAQYVIGLVLLYLLVERAHFSKFVAPILVVFVSAPITYVLSRYVIGRGLTPSPGSG